MAVLTLQEFADLADQRFGEIADGVMEKGEDMISTFYSESPTDLITERGSALTPMGSFQDFTGTGTQTRTSP